MFQQLVLMDCDGGVDDYLATMLLMTTSCSSGRGKGASEQEGLLGQGDNSIQNSRIQNSKLLPTPDEAALMRRFPPPPPASRLPTPTIPHPTPCSSLLATHYLLPSN